MSTPPFKHEPLDHARPSIRVLRVSRLSSENGLIRCKIRHTTINSLYTCLSYRWGEPDDGGGPFDILVNSKIYRVRQNLYQFLQRAQGRSLGWLWIDALCIDQNNTAERSHQVRHMGRIYSRAKEVLVWLGDTSDEWWSPSSRYLPSGEHSYSTILQMTNSYWQRAWVTQEIALARCVSFMAGAATARPGILANLLTRRTLPPQEMESITQLLSLSKKRKVSDVTNLTLVQRLEQMQYKQCLFPRDKIYSLLSLCKDGRNMVVDYDQSDAAFLFQTLHQFSVSCLCMARLLAECVVHPLDSFEGLQNTHSGKLILEMKLKPGNRKPIQKAVVKSSNGTSPDVEYTSRLCRDCHIYLEDYSQKGQYVFCLQAICRNTPGHLYWTQSHSHVLQFQGPQYILGADKLKLIAPNWGLICISNSATDEHVLRFTFKGLADILHYTSWKSLYPSAVFDTELCRCCDMGAAERTKSRLGSLSILDPSMSEQDGKLDG